MLTLEHMTFWAMAKNGTYVAAFFMSLQYLGFHPESLAIFTVLMMVDFVTGVARSSKVDGGQSVTSEGWRVGIVKKVLTMTALFTLGLTGKGVGFDIATVVQGSVTVLILAEAYSILGNIHSYMTGKPKDEFDAISVILNSVGKILFSFDRK